MRLVPIDEGVEEVRKAALEERIRHYDPIVSTMAELMPQIQKPPIAKRGNRTAALAVQNANLRLYKSLDRQRLGSQTPAVMLPDSTMENPTAPSAVTPLPQVDVPRMYRPKLQRLFEELAKHPGVITRSDADELVIDGVLQRGTTFSGAIRSLYVNSVMPASGARELAIRLRTLNVPKEMLSSKFAQSVFPRQSGKGIRWPGKPSRVLHVYK